MQVLAQSGGLLFLLIAIARLFTLMLSSSQADLHLASMLYKEPESESELVAPKRCSMRSCMFNCGMAKCSKKNEIYAEAQSSLARELSALYLLRKVRFLDQAMKLLLTKNKAT